MKNDGIGHEGRARYCLDALQEHTVAIRGLTEKVLKKHRPELDKALTEINEYFDDLERHPPALERNVKMLLICKFLNHVYAAIILTQCGLIVDALLCARNALEVVAYHWLVCLDPVAAELYGNDETPRPVEVRKRLQELGADGWLIGQLYSMHSEVTHMGRLWERFGLTWEAPAQGSLCIGGAFRVEDGEHLFGDYLPLLLGLFRTPVRAQQDGR